MTSRRTEEIAKLHRKMFELHDEENWDAFQDNAMNYLISLGHPEEESEEASRHVVRAYQFADEAVVSQNKGDKKRESEMYKRCFEEHAEALRVIGAETDSVRYKVGWYKAARHRNHPSVLWNLFMEHFTRFGWPKLGLALKCTYITAFKAYGAHNAHEWENLERILIDYWSTISDYHKGGFKLPVEL